MPRPIPDSAPSIEAVARALRRQPARAVTLARAIFEQRPSEADRSRLYELVNSAARSLSGAAATDAWLLVANDAWQAGRPGIAEEAARAAEMQARASGDRRSLGLTQLARARQFAARSRYRDALAAADDALVTVKERERDLEARVHVLRAAIASHTLSPEAPRHARRAVLLATELGDEGLRGASLAQLGIALVERGVHGEAREVLAVARSIARARRDADAVCRAEIYLSMLELDRGRPVAAQRHVAAAREAAEQSRSRIAMAFVLGSNGVVQLARKHAVAAARDLARAEVLLDEVGDRHARVTFLAFLGAAEALSGRAAESTLRFADARTILSDDDEAIYPRVLVDVLSLGASPDARALAQIERGPVHAGWADVRVACRIVRASRAAPIRAPRARIREGLVVGPDAMWAVLDGAPAIELASRPSLRRLFTVLVRARTRSPARFVAPLALAREVWKDDARIAERLLLGRLHVSISTLRRMGLRAVLERSADGYRLAPETVLHTTR